MGIHERLLNFILYVNWILFTIAVCVSMTLAPAKFTLGIIAGGLITTINFHLLHKTLKQALTPPYLSSHRVVVAKYYIRFTVTAAVIGVLISFKLVNPLGLFTGLSIVVASIMLAAFRELTILILKEAV